MKTITTLGVVLCMAGVASYAKDLDGKLIDASCYQTWSTSAASGQKPVKLDKIDRIARRHRRPPLLRCWQTERSTS
jgi:hypothetical protein